MISKFKKTFINETNLFTILLLLFGDASNGKKKKTTYSLFFGSLTEYKDIRLREIRIYLVNH
jgi:hypothetical protein